MYMENMRNIGISAHIDSGKTTLTERILFYSKKIHKIGEVKGKHSTATMDSMELEKERGITISSAATNVVWDNHQLNIIDTPGHVDFTMEVENALRVLDGAILVLCSVAGVQSQSITVDRQLKRYGVPHIAFINKLDRVGSDPNKVKDQLIEKLDHNAVLMQIPIGLEHQFHGIIDLVTMTARFFEGPNGEQVTTKEIPAEYLEQAEEKREEMLDAASMFSDDLAEAYLEGEETEEMIFKAIREGTISKKLTPVFMGSAFKNKGVQMLLDAIIHYLPNPNQIENIAHDLNDNRKDILLKIDPNLPSVALAFKLENQQYGQLTYLRVYQGKIEKGMTIYNNRTGNRSKVGRLAKMHAANMEEIERADAGDIVAIFGIDCALGDTFTTSEISYTMRDTFIPTPIISLSLKTNDNQAMKNLAKALNRFTKEDPTFKTYYDDETEETIISGMGELHLSVYIERMRREYDVNVEVGAPKVAYRETITQEVEFTHIHKKQSGGRGQYAKISGVIAPTGDDDNIFEEHIKGGNIPSIYVPGCEKGFNKYIEKGDYTGFPIVGMTLLIDDGNYHPVDSSILAFEVATRTALRENYNKAKPQILEPIMKISVETPSEFRGNVMATINQRRGLINDAIVENHFTRIEAELPLSESFGYATLLRSSTQGKAEFTMEFDKYKPLPKNLAEKVMKEIAEEKAKN
ncbi:MAG: elongation factor G [Candidatus Cloacimonadota bacterium]|nr:elongation factor G [Candidatus Cloacimonadota bacterium]